MRGGRVRRGLALLGAVALVSSGCSGGDAGADDASEGRTLDRPNVVLVITDDQTVDMMVGLPAVQELLGAGGTTFTRAAVAMPLCCPARAALLTGQTSHTNGVRDNLAPDGGFTRLDWSRTVATELQGAGYRTAHVGRTLNDYTIDARPLVPPGWDEWYTPLEDNTRSFIARGASMVANGELVTMSPFTHTDDALADIAVGVVDRWVDGDEPFYLEVGSVAPHTARPEVGGSALLPVPADRDLGALDIVPLPEAPPPDEPGKPDWVAANASDLDPDFVRQYWSRALESLRTVDAMVDSIAGRLDRAGVLDDTVFLFTSDNGIMLGEHGLSLDKVTPYEPSVVVPLLVRGPGFPEGEEVGSPVSQVDLAPTVLAAAGIEVPGWMEGVPLQDAVEAPAIADLRTVLVESPPTPRPAPPFVQVRSGDLVLTRYETGEAELSDLAADPHQTRNLVDDPTYADDLAALDGLADALRDCAGDGCRVYDSEARP